MKQLTYAGIGSRQTPPDIMEMMFEIADTLAKRNWILRSGHADGADLAFEKGCIEGEGKKEIYLPWNGYNGHVENYEDYLTHSSLPAHQEAMKMAQNFHPNWSALTLGGRLLQARNSYQMLGQHMSLIEKSDMVICWTKNGKRSGGTGQALRLAVHYDIPIFDLALPDTLDRLEQFIQDAEIANHP